MNIVSNEKMIDAIAKYITKQELGNTYNKYAKNNSFVLQVSGTKNASKVIEHFYKGANIYMERKYKAAEKYWQ